MDGAALGLLLGRGEILPGGAPVVQFQIRYQAARQALGFIDVGKSGGDFHARTELQPDWVRLPAGQEELVRESVKVASP